MKLFLIFIYFLSVYKAEIVKPLAEKIIEHFGLFEPLIIGQKSPYLTSVVRLLQSKDMYFKVTNNATLDLAKLK